jgi:hypothetical protein
MNTTSRCVLLLAAGLTASTLSWGQQQPIRNFPTGTLRGTVEFFDYPQATLNGRVTQLSPGARVRDTQNRIVLPGQLTGSKWVVHYTLDTVGAQVRDVWFLTAEEVAIRPWPTTPEELQTWTFDATAKKWTKP